MTQVIAGGNSAIEAAAMRYVIEYERLAGREPQDTRHVRSAAADLISGDRLIEVKAAGGTSRGNDLWLEPAQYEAARTHPNFHLYLVENIRQGDPAHFVLLDIHGDQLRRLLGRAKEQRYFTVPWPAAEYAAAIAALPNHDGGARSE
jgi:hypothetical protein